MMPTRPSANVRTRPLIDASARRGTSTGSVAKHFAKPGLYKIQWVGDGFSSAVLEIRITDK